MLTYYITSCNNVDMKLKNYLKYKNLTISRFAFEAKLKQPHLSLIINGSRRPSPELALKIEEATKGEVTVLELLFPKETTRG